ncbi:MAG: glycerol-3-phosphate 1-O-acyltransferase PlsY [Desulfobulbaceae bacterium]|nr:glycerol-3-phosphate 1-O-acyltransferase PlsY [Desulfobulbaceae bacterium]
MSSSGFLCILFSYLVGAIPFGILLSRRSGIDIRTQGSGNIGATNVARLLGKKLGILTLLCDVAKGFLPIFCTALLVQQDPSRTLIMALSGAATVLGHMFPVYLRFHGGKGVATALGLFLYLAPWAVALVLLVFLATVRFSGYVSAGSLTAAASMPLWLLMLDGEPWKIALAFFVVVLIWFKHSGNIKRLLNRTEKTWKKNNGTAA